MDGIIVSQNADLHYFAGTDRRSSLWIPRSGEPILFVFRGIEWARESSGLAKVEELENPRELPARLLKAGLTNLSVVGLEMDVLPAAQYLRYGKLFPTCKWADASALIRDIRMIKSEWELRQLRNAWPMVQAVFETMKRELHEGVREFSLLSHIERVSREHGHPGFMRTRGFNQGLVYTQILSGEDAVVTSFGSGPLGGRGSAGYEHGSSNRIIKRGDSVILDYCSYFAGYMLDVTRTFCIGDLSEKLYKAYETSRAIQDAVVAAAKIGVACDSLYHLAESLAETKGLKQNFMGLGKSVGFIGHGIGLEVDELPVIAPGVKTLLEPGMVICLEPKFVFPEGAVGIENTWFVSEAGLECLTPYEEEIIKK